MFYMALRNKGTIVTLNYNTLILNAFENLEILKFNVEEEEERQHCTIVVRVL